MGSWVNNANKFEFKTMDKIVQTPNYPFYGWDHFYVGKYYNNGERTRTVTYDKQNRNFLLGKIFVEDKLVLDGERWGHFKIDTRATPYTLVWYSKPVRRLIPITRDFVGQDELTVSAWHTPGKELKFETNLPEFRTMKITSAGPTKTFWFNGEEKATVDFDSSSKKASHTMHLPFYGMVFWWTGRYGKTVERKMTVFFDKINKSILFVPKMSMNTVLTINGEKTSEIVFDNTQAKKHFKFFWAPDA